MQAFKDLCEEAATEEETALAEWLQPEAISNKTANQVPLAAGIIHQHVREILLLALLRGIRTTR